MSIQEKLPQVPRKPGVYLFRNAKHEIIYIGKAKNLRQRLRSYFQSEVRQPPKTQSLVRNITGLEWIVTANEVEALLTEANMIREYAPHYNIDLKDDKSFPFIRITRELFPQVLLTRNVVRDGSRYFGPYTDVKLFRRTLKALHKVFPIRSCSYPLDEAGVAAKKVSVCLDYHIRKCEGPCEGYVSAEVYGTMIARVMQFLQGRTGPAEEFITSQMEAAARDLRYEDAAVYRDQLQAIQSFKSRQRQVASDFDDRDIIVLAREDELGLAVIMQVRTGRIFSREKLRLQRLYEPDEAVLETVISRFYLEGESLPGELVLELFPRNSEQLLEWLRSRRHGRVVMTVPRRGEKVRMLQLARRNARLLLGEWILERRRRREAVPGMVTRLQEDLQLKAPPRRIEAFDISHLGGTGTVASLVCFVDGQPRKSEYRRFNIRSVKGIDDFAAMREVVSRRYTRLQKEQSPLPDLVLVDGGKGQVGMAVSALRSLGLDYIAVIGLAKRLEEVFLPGTPAPQTIPRGSPGLILLRRIRDEAHRFAVSFQRLKRSHTSLESIFTSIRGVGPKRLHTLLNSYPDVAAIAGEDPAALALRTSLPEQLARRVIARARSFMAVQKKTGNTTDFT